ncbi:MAG: hypothetical protein HLX50_20735 [Alteromonadaceae bacterium]|nr:hypothetical protein [Alteromonadaceae bacterium]
MSCLVRLSYLLSHLSVHEKAPGRYHDHQDKLHQDDYGVEIHEIDNLL